VHVLPSTPQFVGMNTILQNPETEQEDFIFYFDRVLPCGVSTFADTYNVISKALRW
jgi:uridine kinase